MKKQPIVALGLLLLIPVVFKLGGLLFSLINPEHAAGHPNYVRNYQLLSFLQHTSFLAMFAVVASLWLGACFLVIQSKKRSLGWLCLAAFGPFGFAVLAMLRDQAPADTDLYERFLRNLNRFVRLGYHVCIFVVIWMVADQAMVLKRNLMIKYESATTGVPTAQIIDQQNASSGMWAFSEGLEVMYLVVLLYLIWPVVFTMVGRIAARTAAPKAR
ncbi:MAG: hypothetical protein HY010_11335 [Acidobacteria bacterium]|nr:hypothetical protein [Acidobacteriota bacterium]